MPDFSDFDTRRYRILEVRTGYSQWVPTYERTVEDAMDIALLEALTSAPWGTLGSAVDLGCGTGRTGVWLHRQGLSAIDGVDSTPEMIEVAGHKGVYRRLTESDVGSTGLDSSEYDLAIACLVDEHLADLRPLYREAWRLATSGGFFVLVGYHPHFIMAFGVPTHFDGPSGKPIAIETHVHLLSDHVSAALGAGWVLLEMRERLIDDTWLKLKPKWKRYRNHPISFAFVWRKPWPQT